MVQLSRPSEARARAIHEMYFSASSHDLYPNPEAAPIIELCIAVLLKMKIH